MPLPWGGSLPAPAVLQQAGSVEVKQQPLCALGRSQQFLAYKEHQALLVCGAPRMRRAAPQIAVQIIGHPTKAADCEQLRLKLLTEDACPEQIRSARISSASQCPINVDRPASHNLGTGANRAHDDEITFFKGHCLAGADGTVHQHCRHVLRCDLALNACTHVDRGLCLELAYDPDELGSRQSL